MKIKVNCDNQDCTAKSSLIAVSYFDKEKEADKVCMYFCSKCSTVSQLERIPFNKQVTSFEVLIIKEGGEIDIKAMQNKHDPRCIRCSKSIISYQEWRQPTKKEALHYLFIDKRNHNNNDGSGCGYDICPNYIKATRCRTIIHFLKQVTIPIFTDRSCIVKLYIESPKQKILRTFAGYLCLFCNKIFFMEKLPHIKWKTIHEWRNLEFVPFNTNIGLGNSTKYDTLGIYSRNNDF
ncbi:MAG TPA: hypothetical protein VGR54_07385 [Nitrosopumilaceae archaeon]|nr:hypothetical protein [Nitrosopumilaceae archaeon]